MHQNNNQLGVVMYMKAILKETVPVRQYITDLGCAEHHPHFGSKFISSGVMHIYLPKDSPSSVSPTQNSERLGLNTRDRDWLSLF